MQALVRDITDRKQAEDELAKYRDHLEELVEERTIELKEAQQKLLTTERLAVLGQVAGSISHEIRNPLSIIDSSAYYLKRKFKNIDPKVNQHLDRIQRNVKRSNAIIESLLNLTKMKEPKVEPFDLAMLVNKSVSALKKPIKIDVNVDMSNENLSITGDYELIRMTFKNIIKNAFDAMGDEGRLAIRGDIVDEGQFVQMIFEDTGPGISPENINKIFQPLFTTRAVGIGFGLSICQQVVEKHGGHNRGKIRTGKGGKLYCAASIKLALRLMTQETP